MEILDPATGTGTFITELIETLPLAQLEYKYANEIHCNEVAILPYYIANLNIEYTYKQRTGTFKEFNHICFVDTLDNVGFVHTGKQLNFFGMTDENAARITEQNARKISVVIGNPPYNAWQENFNNQNANRAYPEIDKRIKETYIKAGTAQNQMGVYDMYARFIRWASDRLDQNGVIAFITNRTYLDSRAFDGFRKVAANEFSHIYIVDLGGSVRKNPKLSGTTHNVFGIQTGVAIAFMVKTEKKGKIPTQIFYTRRPEYELASEKLDFLRSVSFSEISFEYVRPDKKHNWLNVTDNDWDELLPLIDREKKSGKAIFDLFSRGNASQRDEWVYDFSKDTLEKKIGYFVEVYQATLQDKEFSRRLSIKWDRELTKYLEQKVDKQFEPGKIIKSLYRPFISTYFYFDRHFNGMTYQLPGIFPTSESKNLTICATDAGSEKPFMCLVSDKLPDLHLVGAGSSTQCLPLYRYLPDGTRVENITDWALGQFQKRYKAASGKSAITQSPNQPITKLDIFHYVYAVLHHPAYRAKYEINLKREFPRIPFYDDFWQWAGWGRRLMDLHLGYEGVEPWELERVEREVRGENKVMLKAVKPQTQERRSSRETVEGSGAQDERRSDLSGVSAQERRSSLDTVDLGDTPDERRSLIEIDSKTTLRGVPPEAWEYRLGTYSALEWVLERYKEKKPKDPTIAEKFNTYRFADYKEQVIELLGKVCRVSVETVRVVKEMPE